MNRLIIKNLGYDFQNENLLELGEGFKKGLGDILYILPNFTLLKDSRYGLLENLNSIRMENIITFDDLATKYTDGNVRYLTVEEVGVVIQMAVSRLGSDTLIPFKEVSETRGFSYEVAELILKLKAANIAPEDFHREVRDDVELLEISKIYFEYENILRVKGLDDQSGLYQRAIRNLKNHDIYGISKIIIFGFIEFRSQELELIKVLAEKGIELLVQYPFDMKRSNRKTEKIIDDFKKLDFKIIRNDSVMELENAKLAYDGFTLDENAYSIPATQISASSNYYEVKRVFQEIKPKLSLLKPSEISIIITDEYEELIKVVAKEENIPISIMNEESAKNLPIVRAAINFFELILSEERTNLITFVKDEYFNNFETEDKLASEFGIRILDYRGLYVDYYKVEDKVGEFILHLRDFKNEIYKAPGIKIKEYLESLNLRRKIFNAYESHGDLNLLKQSLKSLDIIESTVDSINQLSEVIDIKEDIIFELLIEKLYASSYYENSNIEGIRVSKLINSVGVKSKIKAILGLSPAYPSINKNTYLNGDKFKEYYSKLGILLKDKYDSYDNELLKFYQAVANSEELILSYTYDNVEMKEEYSTFLKDLLDRIDKKSVEKVESYGFINHDVAEINTDRDRAVAKVFLSEDENIRLNFMKRDELEVLNSITIDYVGKLNDAGDEFLSFKGNLTDPKNLDYMMNKGRKIEYSYSMLNEYIKCPFRYYMKYVAGIVPVQMEYEDKFMLERGNFYHIILRNLYEKTPDLIEKDMEEIKSLLINEIKNYVSTLKLSQEEEKVSEEVYFNFLIALIKQEIDHKSEFTKKFIPWKLESGFKRNIGDIVIRGYIDRIDRAEDGTYIVIDYKSKNPPSDTSVRLLKDVQLPVYGYLLDKENTVAGLYYAIETGSITFPFFLEGFTNNKSLKGKLSRENLSNLFSDLENKIINIDESIKNGRFTVEPIDTKACEYCDYRNICRKEELRNDV